MARLSSEEKKQAIEEFIKTHQKMYAKGTSAAKAFTLCSYDTLKSWAKEIYGKNLVDLFTERGVLVTDEKEQDVLARKVFEQLKTAYAGKQPADSPEQLRSDNPGIAVDVYLEWLRLSHPGEDLDNDLFEAMMCGIIADPVASDNGLKKVLAHAIAPFGNKLGPVLSLGSIFDDPSVPYFIYMFRSKAKYVKHVCDRIREVFGITAEEYFIKAGRLLSREKAAAVFKSEFEKLKKQEKGEKYECPSNILYRSSKTYTRDMINYLYDEAAAQGLEGKDADAYVDQIFIDADLKPGVKTKAAIEEEAKNEAAAKKAEAAMAAKEAHKARLYDDIDSVDVESLAKLAGISGTEEEYPRDRQLKVDVDGKTFIVKFGLKRNINRLKAYRPLDGKTAYETMLTREQVIERIDKEDPNFRSDAREYATAEFIDENPIAGETAQRRFLFLKAVGVLLSRPGALEALVRFAPKKKNGTFHKNRIVRIASSMVAVHPNTVFEITGRLKDDMTMYVSFEDADVTPENYEKSKDDFISNHWDLFIS